MKLKSVRVQNFRCILDSTEFRIEPVTCLVGKNESGKSAILDALKGLKPLENPDKYTYDRLRDYPRPFLDEFDERHQNGWAVVLSTNWELDDDDIEAVEDVLGRGSVSDRIAIVRKYHDKQQRYWTVKINEDVAIKHLLDSAKVTDTERAALATYTTVKELRAHITAGDPPSDSLKALKTALSGISEHGASNHAGTILDARMPAFFHFTNYDLMPGDVSLEDFRAEVSANQLDGPLTVFKSFLDMAKVSVDEIAGTTDREALQARVEAASSAISRRIFKYWSQNKNLKVRFKVQSKALPGRPQEQGFVMETRIENTLWDVSVPFGERSTGFMWFFSFLARFSQVRRTHGNVIILLDEPGLNLHAKAQADLLRYIDDELKPNHQVVYTTHSPFMIPASKLHTARTVEDKTAAEADEKDAGTKVGEEYLKVDRETLFPLQGALGYEITQTLFVGPHALLVEGPGDILMLQSASHELAKRKRTPLDMRWTMCPVGGIGNVQAFVSLFGGENALHIAMLTDLAKGEKAKIERVRSQKILEENHIFTADMFCGQDEADTEDFFGPTLYPSMVNQAFGLSGKQKLSAKKIAEVQTSTPRVLKRVEDIFRTLADAPEFDHFTAPAWLIENRTLWDEDAAETDKALERFENLFKALNALLPGR